MSTICRYTKLTGCLLLCFAETPHLHSSSPQESYLAPKLKQLVAYCSSSDACEEGLTELLEDVGGDEACFDEEASVEECEN